MANEPTGRRCETGRIARRPRRSNERYGQTRRSSLKSFQTIECFLRLPSARRAIGCESGSGPIPPLDSHPRVLGSQPAVPALCDLRIEAVTYRAGGHKTLCAEAVRTGDSRTAIGKGDCAAMASLRQRLIHALHAVLWPARPVHDHGAITRCLQQLCQQLPAIGNFG